MKLGMRGGPGRAAEISGHSAPNATAKVATTAKRRRVVLMRRILAHAPPGGL
jgi:hypothetical protein